MSPYLLGGILADAIMLVMNCAGAQVSREPKSLMILDTS